MAKKMTVREAKEIKRRWKKRISEIKIEGEIRIIDDLLRDLEKICIDWVAKDFSRRNVLY